MNHSKNSAGPGSPTQGGQTLAARLTMKLPLKRWLFLAHRWLGIAGCLLFFLWFLSGMVMLYVGYPKLTYAERYAHLPALQAEAKLLGPQQALAAAGIKPPILRLRLSRSRGGHPAYFVTLPPDAAAREAGEAEGTTLIVDARRGQRLDTPTPQALMASAHSFAAQDAPSRGGATDTSDAVDTSEAADTPGADGTSDAATAEDGVPSKAALAAHPTPVYEGTTDEDPFTHSQSLRKHEPLHKIQLNDAANTRLYLSGQTGEVMLDANRIERVFNYVGAWLHWLYIFRGGIFDASWSDIVIWLSCFCVLIALTGTIVGVMRWRFNGRYRSGSRSPYPAGMMRWHHTFGLVFALTTITWVFSGLMSMRPWDIFDSGAPRFTQAQITGEQLDLSQPLADPQTLLQLARQPVHELQWLPFPGQSVVLALNAQGDATRQDAVTGQPRPLDDNTLQQTVQKAIPYPIAHIERLEHDDFYYYRREPHTMNGGEYKPLPVWRVVFDDANQTWLHINPRTGELLGQLDATSRLDRWLFALLHSWDWLPLLRTRPLWDILMLTLGIGGFILSTAGVVIGWRRLKFKAQKWQKWQAQRG